MKIKVQQSNSWNWIDCNIVIHSILNNTDIYRQLESNCNLVDEDYQLYKGTFNLNIQLKKSFNFSPRIGWNWHKSWKIPEILVLPDIGDNQLHMSIKCRIICVFVEDATTMKTVDLEGNQNIEYCQLKKGFMIENIKFTQTSYKVEGKYFHLIIEIYQQDRLMQTELPLKCVISPPIFVDSRKAARNTKRFDYLKVVSSVQIFTPYILQKKQVVRQGKREQTVVEDDIFGLDSYFNAQNIRNKCRHPFFIAIKFQSLFNLYYNSLIIKKSKNYEGLIEQIQTILVTSPSQEKEKEKGSDKNHHILLLHLKVQLDERQTILFLQNCSQIKNHHVIVSGNQFNSDVWQQLDAELLKSNYKDLYLKLPTLSKVEQNKIKEEFDISSDESVSQNQLKIPKKNQFENYYHQTIEIQKNKKACIYKE